MIKINCKNEKNFVKPTLISTKKKLKIKTFLLQYKQNNPYLTQLDLEKEINFKN